MGLCGKSPGGIIVQDPLTQTIRVTKAIQRAERHSTVEPQRQKQHLGTQKMCGLRG